MRELTLRRNNIDIYSARKRRAPMSGKVYGAANVIERYDSPQYSRRHANTDSRFLPRVLFPRYPPFTSSPSPLAEKSQRIGVPQIPQSEEIASTYVLVSDGRPSVRAKLHASGMRRNLSIDRSIDRHCVFPCFLPSSARHIANTR